MPRDVRAWLPYLREPLALFGGRYPLIGAPSAQLGIFPALFWGRPSRSWGRLPLCWTPLPPISNRVPLFGGCPALSWDRLPKPILSALSAFIRVPFSSIVAAGPTYNRLTWNFTHGDDAVAYQQNS